VFDNSISPLFRQIFRHEQNAQPCVSSGYAAVAHFAHGEKFPQKIAKSELSNTP